MKNLIRKAANYLGLEISRYHRLRAAGQLVKALEISGVDIIFDIGANKGQFAKEVREHGYKGQIVSFEPLSAAHKALRLCSDLDSAWEAHSRLAVGNYDGDIKINIAGNSLSSSVLPMLQAHVNSAPGSEYVGYEQVPIARLDSVAQRYLTAQSKPFIKIDTQGFEWQVLDGAPETLLKAQGLLCEVSLIPLYDGQRMWRDVVDRLDANGFMLWTLQQGFTNPVTGQSLQLDAIFMRKDLFNA